MVVTSKTDIVELFRDFKKSTNDDAGNAVQEFINLRQPDLRDFIIGRAASKQNLPAALAAVPWLLACSALRAKDAFVAQAGRLFCAPQAGASGTFGDANWLYRLK
jgi:hypothetical protein